MTEKLMLPAESGCKVCHKCTWVKRGEVYHCPYGGPFSGYQTSSGKKFILGETLVEESP